MSALYQVDGGVPLHGAITLSGAKNAASKILLATMLSSEPSVIDNVPLLGETDIAAELIEQFGGRVARHGHRWTVTTPTIAQPRITGLSRKNRLPILTLGILLNRTGEAEVPIVGGIKSDRGRSIITSPPYAKWARRFPLRRPVFAPPLSA